MNLLKRLEAVDPETLFEERLEANRRFFSATEKSIDYVEDLAVINNMPGMLEILQKAAKTGTAIQIITGPIPEDGHLISPQSAAAFKKYLCRIVPDSFLEFLQQKSVSLYKSPENPSRHFCLIDKGRIVILDRMRHDYGQIVARVAVVNPLVLGERFSRKFQALKDKSEEVILAP